MVLPFILYSINNYYGLLKCLHLFINEVGFVTFLYQNIILQFWVEELMNFIFGNLLIPMTYFMLQGAKKNYILIKIIDSLNA